MYEWVRIMSGLTLTHQQIELLVIAQVTIRYVEIYFLSKLIHYIYKFYTHMGINSTLLNLKYAFTIVFFLFTTCLPGPHSLKGLSIEI